MLKWSWMVGICVLLAVGCGVSDRYAVGLDRSLLSGSPSGAFGSMQGSHVAALELDLGAGEPVRAHPMEGDEGSEDPANRDGMSFMFTHPMSGSKLKPGALTITYGVENDRQITIDGQITLQIGSSGAGVLPVKIQKNVKLKPGLNKFDHATKATTPGTYKLMGSISVGGKIRSYDDVTFEVEEP